jgi:hypothetical protein
MNTYFDDLERDERIERIEAGETDVLRQLVPILKRGAVKRLQGKA